MTVSSPIQFSAKVVGLLIFGLAATTPSYALEELKILEPVGQMNGPDKRSIGWEWHYVDQNGKPGFMRKVAGDDSFASYQRSDGCRWTRSTRGFAPAIKWSDCPSSGKASVDFSGGEIWPLEVGKTFNYSMNGTSSFLNFGWSGNRSCKVSYRVRIKIAIGEFDSFKVSCVEKWGTRNWWLSPQIGTAVAYQQITSRGKTILQELSHIVVP